MKFQLFKFTWQGNAKLQVTCIKLKEHFICFANLACQITLNLFLLTYLDIMSLILLLHVLHILRYQLYTPLLIPLKQFFNPRAYQNLKMFKDYFEFCVYFIAFFQILICLRLATTASDRPGDSIQPVIVLCGLCTQTILTAAAHRFTFINIIIE